MRYLLIFATLVATSAVAQPQITWQKYFISSTNTVNCLTSVQLADSGFFISSTNPSLIQRGLLIRTDKYGDTIFTRKIDYWANICKTFDNGFVLGGGDNGLAIIEKLDSNFNTEWLQTYNSIPTGFATQCQDSGYVLAGADWIIKTDPMGQVVWQKNLAGSFEFVTESYNGEILAVGGFGYYKYLSTLLDSSGVIKWQKVYSDFSIGGGGGQFYLHGAVQLPDSNFLVVANNDKNPFYANSGGFDLAKIDFSTGDTIWTKQFPTFNTYTYIASISNIKDNYAFVSLGDQLFKIDFNGNIIWSLPTYDVIHSVTTCTDGGAAFAGAKLVSGPQTQYLATYAKTDSLGNIYNYQGIPSIAVNELRAYPNPAFNELAIRSSQLANGQEVTVTIYDMLGKVQLQQTVIPQGDFTVDVNALPSGIYMLQLKQEDRLFTGRFVKE